MTLFAVEIKLYVFKICKNFFARYESRCGMFDSRIPLRQPVSIVCVSPRAARDASSNRRRGSRRGKKEFVRGGKKANEKAQGPHDCPERRRRCVAAIMGPRSFCEADRSVGHCLEMIATRSGLLII